MVCLHIFNKMSCLLTKISSLLRLYYWMFFASTEVFDGMFSGILRDIFPKYIFLKYIFQCALIGGLVVKTILFNLHSTR